MKILNFGEVSILVNDFTKTNKDIIIHIARNVKRVNIVTNHIEKCKKIEEYLYDEFGIMLNISNNSRKSLLKSKLIINIDFPEELINRYRVYDKAIIINVNEKLDIKSKRFNGINVSYYNIIMPEEYRINNFNDEIIYESLIYEKNNYNEFRNKILEDKIVIDKLIGNNGTIREKEIIEI